MRATNESRKRAREPGPFCMRRCLHLVRALLDDHDLVGAMMIAPAVVMAAVMAALDDDLLHGLGLCDLDGRRHERETENGGEGNGDFLHEVLLWVQPCQQ